MAAERETYAEDLEAKLNEAKARIEELEAKADRETGTSSAPYREKITELRSRLHDMEQQVHAMREAKGEAWDGFKTGLEDTWKTFTNAMSIAGYMEERRSYLQELEEKLKEGRARINELKTRAEHAEGEVKVHYEEEIERLLPKLELAESKVDALENSKEEAWGSLKEGVETAWNDLKGGLAEALSKFK